MINNDYSRAPLATRLRPGYFVLKRKPNEGLPAGTDDLRELRNLVALDCCNRDNEKDLSSVKEFSYLDQSTSISTPLNSIVVLRSLGSGDFGSVYLTRQCQNELRALKVMPQSAQSAREVLIHMTASRMSDRSPHILMACDWFRTVTATDTGRAPLLCLTLELTWTTLSDLVRQCNGLEEERLVDLMAQLVDGLAFLHHQVEIIHGDLKADNVLLTFDGRARIADLGSATPLQWGTSLPAGQPPLRFGSRFHAPPESLQAGAPIWHVADWFAFGLCAFQAFFGGRLVTERQSGGGSPDPKYLETVERWFVLGHARTFCQNTPIKSYPSKILTHFLRALLCAKPSLRLGADGAAEVQNHSLFEGRDWTALRYSDYRKLPRQHQRGSLAPLLPCDVPGLMDVRSAYQSKS